MKTSSVVQRYQKLYESGILGLVDFINSALDDIRSQVLTVDEYEQILSYLLSGEKILEHPMQIDRGVATIQGGAM